MISICLRSSSNIVSGLSKGVGDGEGVYQDVFFHLIDGEQMQQKFEFFFVSRRIRITLIPQAQQMYSVCIHDAQEMQDECRVIYFL